MAGCQTEDILATADLDWADISAEVPERDKNRLWTPAGTASDVYPYHLANGALEFEVLRVPTDKGRRFFQRQPDEHAASGYRWNLDGVTRVLYRLPQVIEAVTSGHVIHLCEGEKDVHSLLSVIPDGDEATTSSGGAGRWRHEYGHYLSGATVVIYADLDDVGREHAREVRQNLTVEHGCSVSIVEPRPGRLKSGQPIKDITDHLLAGFTLNDLLETTPDSAAAKARSGVDWIDITKRPEHEWDFIIPNVLARSERLLLVGVEGHGKSAWSRQIAACVASGIHPFTNAAIEPRRVLYIDAENHPGQYLGDWKILHWLCRNHGDPQPGMLTVLEEWDSTIDLIAPKGRTWLKERVHAYKPDLLILGPLKNLVQKNLAEHEVVSQLRWCINEVRSISGAAVIMEHHAPLRMSGDKVRELRPYGNSLFLGWPDYGYALQPTEIKGTYEWRQFRGDRVRGRGWPEAFRWGNTGQGEWPWETEILE